MTIIIVTTNFTEILKFLDNNKIKVFPTCHGNEMCLHDVCAILAMPKDICKYRCNNYE